MLWLGSANLHCLLCCLCLEARELPLGPLVFAVPLCACDSNKHIAVNEFASSDITEPWGLQLFTAWWNDWVLLHHWDPLMMMEYLIKW